MNMLRCHGHIITYWAHRIPNANPFQTGIGGGSSHAPGASTFLIAPTEEGANEVLDKPGINGKPGARYVVSNAYMPYSILIVFAEWDLTNQGYYTQTDVTKVRTSPEMNQLNLLRNSSMNLLMDTQVKRYNIVVRGKVQDVGFRDYLIALANITKLRGYIFNDIDGTVKMILEGAKDTVNTFLNEIKSRKYVSGVEIDSLQQKELSMDFDIPVRFVKLSTDELYDIDRKLGIGNDLLADIKTNTINIKNGIDDLKTNTINIERGIDHLKINTIDIKNGVYSLNSKFDSLNTNFDLFFEEHKGFNKNIIEHNFRLEKILEKLSEK